MTGRVSRVATIGSVRDAPGLYRRAPALVSTSAVPSACAPAATPAPAARSRPASGWDAAPLSGSVRPVQPTPIAGTAAAKRTPFLAQSRSSHTAPSWFAHPAHTQRQTVASPPSHCSLSMACAPLYLALAIVCSVRYAPGLFCQGCSRSVPPWSPPPTP